MEQGKGKKIHKNYLTQNTTLTSTWRATYMTLLNTLKSYQTQCIGAHQLKHQEHAIIFRLSSGSGFSETTSNKKCTQYDVRDCSRF